MPGFHAEVRLWSEIKHDILRKYLRLFVNKLGASGRIYFVDGFAGQGKYDDGKEGSALIAARIAEEDAAKGKNTLRCINVEADAQTFANLKLHTSSFEKSGLIKNLNGFFEDRLNEILRITQNQIALFFIDPLGAKGIELPLLSEIRTRSKGKSEILLRFDDWRISRTIGNIAGLTSTFDPSRLKAAQSLLKLLQGLADPRIIEKALDDGRIERAALVKSFCRLVTEEKGLYDFALAYPIKHPLTQGHRYFLVHFCDHPDGYIHMANFMAKAERSAQRQRDDLFSNDTTVLPFIAEELEKVINEQKVKIIYKALPAILDDLGQKFSKCELRHLLAEIVKRFEWQYLRSEWEAALKKAKGDGMLEWKAGTLRDSTEITFRSR